MPIYEYRCKDCHQLFEEWQKGFEDRQVACPICGGSSSRLISGSAFVLKGSGWYVTDYSHRRADASNGNGKAASTETSSPPEAPADSAAAEKKENTSTDNSQTG